MIAQPCWHQAVIKGTTRVQTLRSNVLGHPRLRPSRAVPQTWTSDKTTAKLVSTSSTRWATQEENSAMALAGGDDSRSAECPLYGAPLLKCVNVLCLIRM